MSIAIAAQNMIWLFESALLGLVIGCIAGVGEGVGDRLGSVVGDSMGLEGSGIS
jgi:hypothetical protein